MDKTLATIQHKGRACSIIRSIHYKLCQFSVSPDAMV